MPAVIDARNVAVDNDLASRKLQAVDVIGDGNCLFRALSVGLYGDESHHLQLRQDTATHLSLHYTSLFTMAGVSTADFDLDSVGSCVKRIQQANTEAGEKSIVAAADFLRRPIHIYKYVKPPGNSPTVYPPSSGPAVHSPIALAFYEPGHYRAVKPIITPVNLN
jgi:hypothetical protein